MEYKIIIEMKVGIKMNYSPLRYPGGKNKISDFVKLLIRKSNLTDITYIEPFAGGAGVALSLLFSGAVNHIVINDYDKCIYSVWKAILNDTNKFIKLIEETDITIEEWHKQKKIYLSQNNKYSLELALATFFLNRTNRSGILKAGPIGGYNQDGKYLIDARFKKENLIHRIQEIAKKKRQISLYNRDVRSFIKFFLPKYNNVFLYLDPPYYKKGQELYKNFFTDKEHKEIAEYVKQLTCDWIITYDNAIEVIELYENQQCGFFDLSYSLAKNIKTSEFIVLGNDTLWPSEDELSENDININLRRMNHVKHKAVR